MNPTTALLFRLGARLRTPLRVAALMAAPWILAAGAPAAQAQSVSAAAAGYPNKPIRLVVPVTPGSATDAMARFVATALGKAWNATIVVDNKPGAGVQLGTDFVAKASADGYTLLFTFSAHYSQPWVAPTPYDPIKDFEPIAQLANSKLIMATAADSPLRTVQDVVAAARRKPGSLTYGTAGIGGSGHMAGSLLASMANVDISHVPYKSASQVPVDAASGQVDIMFGGLSSSLPLIRSGRLRVIAVTAATRSSSLPDVPTVAEQGLPGYENSSPIWVMAPRGTPAPIVAKLAETLTRIASTAEFREYCLNQGVDPDVLDHAQVVANAPKELEKWKRMVDLTKASSR